MRRFVLIAASCFLIVACGTPVPSSEPESPISATPAVQYAEYSPNLIGKGKTVVIFFYKASDPFSVKNDKLLRTLYGTGGIVVSTYKVDFNTGTGARLTYGALVEDTFVLVDAKGERLGSFIHPTPEEIRIILRGNIPIPPKK